MAICSARFLTGDVPADGPPSWSSALPNPVRCSASRASAFLSMVLRFSRVQFRSVLLTAFRRVPSMASSSLPQWSNLRQSSTKGRKAALKAGAFSRRKSAMVLKSGRNPRKS